MDWGLDIQAAISLPNMGSRNKDTELEKGTALEALAPLEAMGHPLRITEFPSGIHGIVIGRRVDPRREGLARAARRAAHAACAAPLAGSGSWPPSAQRRSLAGVRDSLIGEPTPR